MRYLRICRADVDHTQRTAAFRELNIALRNYARLSGRWELVQRPPDIFYVGSSHVHAENNVLYWPVDDAGIEAFLVQAPFFKARLRRPELVRIFTQVW
jgi:hypothetical protein